MVAVCRSCGGCTSRRRTAQRPGGSATVVPRFSTAWENRQDSIRLPSGKLTSPKFPAPLRTWLWCVNYRVACNSFLFFGVLITEVKQLMQRIVDQYSGWRGAYLDWEGTIQETLVQFKAEQIVRSGPATKFWSTTNSPRSRSMDRRLSSIGAPKP